MNVEDLPDPNDRLGVLKFAASFNGYDAFGSFEACAEAALARRRETLRDLRNELFFSYRASTHRGDDHFLTTYRELLPLFRALITEDGQAE